jgi:hypothetical protein
VATKSKSKTIVNDEYEPSEVEIIDDPTKPVEPVAEEEKIDPTNPQPDVPDWQKEQTFTPMPSNPPPPENLEEAMPDLDKLPESTKSEMKAGKEASEAAGRAGKDEAHAGQHAADKYSER